MKTKVNEKKRLDAAVLFFRIITIFIALFNLTTVCYSDYRNDYKQKLERIAPLLADPLFNLDFKNLRRILESNLAESRYIAFQVVDANTKANVVNLFRTENGEIKHFDEGFPSDYVKPSESIGVPIQMNGNVIGKVFLLNHNQKRERFQ